MSSSSFTSQDLETATNKLKSLTSNLLEIKTRQGPEDSKLITTKANLAVLELKRLNRLSVNHAKKNREITEKKKQHVDRQHLKLQNLLYEKEHLLLEIKKCRDFVSAHESIELITPAEIEAIKPGLIQSFYAKQKSTAPVTIIKMEDSSSNSSSLEDSEAKRTTEDKNGDVTPMFVDDNTTHELTLLRLEQELLQRKELDGKIKNLKAKRDLVENSLNSRRSILEKIPNQVEAFLKGAESLKSDLSTSYDGLLPAILSGTPLPPPSTSSSSSSSSSSSATSSSVSSELSNLQDQLQSPQVLYYHQHLLLPRPLYVLFLQSCGYRDAYKDQSVSINISIEGNLADARAMHRSTTQDLFETLKRFNISTDGKPDTASSAMDTSSIPISSTSSTTLPAVATKLEGSLPFTFSSAPSNASLLNTIVFRRHPLHVSIKINTKVFGAIVIDFYYLVYLNIVTCRCVLEIGSRKEVKPHYNELLSNLFTSDQGKVSPNAAVQHLLDRLQITTPFEQLLDPSEYVYKWTQWICGMDFPTSAVLQLPANASLENISYDSLSLLEYQPDLLGNPVAASEISSRRHLPAILLAIQQRVVSRVQLGTQFNNFDVGKTLDVSAVVFPTLLQEAVPKLKSWENVDAASYKAMRSKFFEAVNKNNANNSNSSEASSEASTDAMSMSDTDNNTDNINNTNTNKEDDADGSTKRSSTPLNDLNLNEEIDDSNDILLYFLCTIQGPEILSAAIKVPINYPIQPSTFKIGFTNTALLESETLRHEISELENVINSNIPQIFLSVSSSERARLLSAQVKCLQVAMQSFITSQGKSLQVEYKINN